MKNSGAWKLPESSEECFGSAINTISKDLSNLGNPRLNDHSKEPAWKCRYAIVLISYIIFLLSNIHRVIMSVVLVAMVNNTAISQISKAESESCLDLMPNVTENSTLYTTKSEGEFIWSPEIQGYILGSYFFGQIFTVMPAGKLVERYGCKWIIVGTLFAISILTMLIPPFSAFSATAIITIQTLRGLAEGLGKPCLTVLIANWAPKNERGFMYSILQSAAGLGPVLGSILAGYISELRGGWSYALYVVGSFGILLAVYVLFFVFENPKEHPHITEAELNFILNQQESKLPRRRPNLPWRQLLTSVPLYALIFAIFGRLWMFSQFAVVNSTFLATILHYPIGQNGLFSAAPFLLFFLISVVASWISGYIETAKTVSVDSLRKFWIAISSLLYSLCLLGVYVAGCNRDLSTIFSILSMGLSALGSPGYFVVIQDMSPTFAGTLYSIATTIGTTAFWILPVIVGHLTDEMQTLEQWNKVFLISIGVIMSSAIVFIIFGSAKIQPWNFVEEENRKKEETHLENDKKGEKQSEKY